MNFSQSSTTVEQEVVGFTASCFDLGPHAGHLAMLAEAKKHCTWLVAAIQIDPSKDRPGKNKPVQSVMERAMALRACRYVDEIVPYQTEEDLVNLIHLLQPDVRFLGEDYIDKPFTGKDIVGPRIIYCGRKHTISSSGLRAKVHAAVEEKNGKAVK